MFDCALLADATFAEEFAKLFQSTLPMKDRIPLSIMNFLELAVWGAWFVVLGQYLNALKFTGKQIGSVYATMSLGTIVAPIFIGTIADKYFSAQHMLGGLHLVGAVLLFVMSRTRTFLPFYMTALAYALVYSPTLSLARTVMNTAADPAIDGPSLRVWGTIGWIVPNLLLKFLLKPGQPVNNRPILLAAALSVVMGIFSFTLPNAPPQGQATPFPFLEALQLLKDPAFATFFGVSFLITIALAFYYSFTSLFLEQKVGVRSDNVGPLMTIGQWMEIIFLLLLPMFVSTLGVRGVLLLGMAAWFVRYLCFTAGGPFPVILLGLALHGICYDFFFEAGFIYVAGNVPAKIMNSGISLFVALTYGLGMYIGTEASGWVNSACTRDVVDPATGAVTRVTDWRKFWLTPAIGVGISLALFAGLFEIKEQPKPAPAPPAPPATETPAEPAAPAEPTDAPK